MGCRPGRIDSLTSEGCLYLIQNGAALLRHPNDVLFAWRLPALEDEMKPELSEEEKKVLDVMASDAMHLEEIGEKLSLPTGFTASVLTMLEMKGMVQRQAGGFFLRIRWD